MDDRPDTFDSDSLSSEEFVARSVLERFPRAVLEIKQGVRGQNFEISFNEAVLLNIDAKGVHYRFPCRHKRNFKWAVIGRSALPRTVEFILRDLAQAGHEVLSPANKPLSKRPIHISRYTRCPGCKEKGGVKVIIHSGSAEVIDSEIFVVISRSVDINGAELSCTFCHWMGIRAELARRRKW